MPIDINILFVQIGPNSLPRFTFSDFDDAPATAGDIFVNRYP